MYVVWPATYALCTSAIDSRALEPLVCFGCLYTSLTVKPVNKPFRFRAVCLLLPVGRYTLFALGTNLTAVEDDLGPGSLGISVGLWNWACSGVRENKT